MSWTHMRRKDRREDPDLLRAAVQTDSSKKHMDSCRRMSAVGPDRATNGILLARQQHKHSQETQAALGEDAIQTSSAAALHVHVEEVLTGVTGVPLTPVMI